MLTGRRLAAAGLGLTFALLAWAALRGSPTRIGALTSDTVSAASLEQSINMSRSRPLVHDTALASDASWHAVAMAEAGTIFHSSDQQLRADAAAGSISVGENVGQTAATAGWQTRMHQAFMGSASHRANILDPTYTRIGVGVALKDGAAYVDELFEDLPAVLRPRPVPTVACSPIVRVGCYYRLEPRSLLP